MACGGCAQRQGKKLYEHTDKNGKVTVYSSEVEAKAATARRGGKYVTK